MTDVHRMIAYAIPAGFAILTLWAVYALIRNRNPHDFFWQLLAIVQVVVGVQAIVGGILFLMGGRPASNGPQWLHYVYGALFPAAVLIAAHRIARSERWRQIPWAVFGFGALICFGLTFRALQTGFGTD
jgi:heme A synthase